MQPFRFSNLYPNTPFVSHKLEPILIRPLKPIKRKKWNRALCSLPKTDVASVSRDGEQFLSDCVYGRKKMMICNEVCVCNELCRSKANTHTHSVLQLWITLIYRLSKCAKLSNWVWLLLEEVEASMQSNGQASTSEIDQIFLSFYGC